MDSINKDPFATIINYKPTSDDITVLEVINRAMRYKNEKDEKNRTFLTNIIEKSNIDDNLKTRLCYIINFLSISCKETDESYSLTLESTQTGLSIYLVFELKKNWSSPKIILSCGTNELESIIAEIFTSNASVEEFTDICKFNLLYNNDKDYTIKVNSLPIEIKLEENKISMTEKEAYRFNEGIFDLYIGTHSISLHDIYGSDNEETLIAIRGNLLFFLSNSYVKKSDVPPQLMSYDCTNTDDTKELFSSVNVYHNYEDNELDQKYFIEVNLELKELKGIRRFNLIENNFYKIYFNDGSTLEVPTNKIFKIGKRPNQKETLAEKALGLK